MAGDATFRHIQACPCCLLCPLSVSYTHWQLNKKKRCDHNQPLSTLIYQPVDRLVSFPFLSSPFICSCFFILLLLHTAALYCDSQ